MNKEVQQIVIIGTGNVAMNLVGALSGSNHLRLSIYGRNTTDSKMIADKYSVSTLQAYSHIPSDTDLLLICVSDNSIPAVLREIPNKEIPIAHTSGGMDMSIFKNLNFLNYGVFYPLQSLSKTDEIDFDQVPICLEFNNEKTRELLLNIARFISKNVHEVSSENRATLHLAAVFANNFTNHLYSISREILKDKNLSFELLRPLIERTASKVMNKDPESQQTGPALRNDQNTISKHRKMIENDQLLLIYDLFTSRIEQLNKKGIEE